MTQNKFQKGFFSFIIVLALAIILITANISQLNQEQIISTSTSELIKSEIAQKDKVLLENNTDTIIESKLIEQMLGKNYNLDYSKNEINKKLHNYLEDKTETIDTFTKQKGKLNIFFLNKNSKTFIYEIDSITYGEYIYASNETKSEKIKSILGNKTKQEFYLPVGYTNRAIILADGIIIIK